MVQLVKCVLCKRHWPSAGKMVKWLYSILHGSLNTPLEHVQFKRLSTPATPLPLHVLGV